jgi:hypothetical protein
MLPAYDLHAGDIVFQLSDPEKRQAIYESIVAYHEKFQAPVYINHNADGEQPGEVVSYENTDEGIFVNWRVADSVDPVRIPKFVSPRLVWGRRVGEQFVDGYQASDGTVYPIVVVELSVTGIPRFDIGQAPGITIALSRDGEFGELPALEIQPPSEVSDMTEEQVQALIMAALQPLAESVTALTAKIDAMAPAAVAPAPEAAPAAAMATDPAMVPPTPEVLMSRKAEFADYSVKLSQSGNAFAVANMDLVRDAFVAGGATAADKLVKRLGSVQATAPTVGKVGSAALSHGPVNPGAADERSATARALDIQKSEGLSWDAARAKAGISVTNRPSL